MLGLNKRTRALLLSISVISLACGSSLAAYAQVAESQADAAKPKPAKRKNAAQQPVRQDASWQTAYAQVGAPTQQPLDTITVAASKTEERAIDALAPVSVVTLEDIQGRQASRVGDLVYNMPGVWLQDRGDDPSTSINIRGLQDFGRVAVVVDGARQDFQRTGHNANGSFFLNPELIGGIDVVRGPTANIYGSGAIGGVVSFRTKDIQDVVRPGEVWGVDTNTVFGTNSARALGSAFGGVHVNPNVDVFAGGTYSTQNNYKDGTGFEVANTENKLSSGIAKLTVRPADGHEIKLGTIYQNDVYNNGQYPRDFTDPNAPVPPPGPGPAPTNAPGTSVYRTGTQNYTTTLGWKYSQPDDKMFDIDSKIYWNRTEQSQTKIFSDPTEQDPTACTSSNPGNAITGCVGDQRRYQLDTYGFDIHNTSRFETGAWDHALTYGGDGFRDGVAVTDQGGNSNITTPSGSRTVSGAFVQWKATYPSVLEIIGALRYDNYRLNSATATAHGDRLSPKITVGLAPGSVFTPYVSYAEGYRAPSTTETLISGAHVAPFGAPYMPCPDGTVGMFCFQSNPNLRPEVGKNKEIGLNVKKNDLFTTGDSFRGKINVFRNDVEDYIDTVFYEAGPTVITTIPFCCAFPGPTSYYQYQNIPAARIQGFELETMYDARKWYVGVSLTLQEGKNTATNVGLYSVQPQKVTTAAGLRWLDNKLTTSVSWTSVSANTNIPSTYLPGTSYDLVNLYVTYSPSPNMALNFSVENLLNQYYRPYAIPRGDANELQNDTLWASASPGIVFKGGLKYHFGG